MVGLLPQHRWWAPHSAVRWKIPSLGGVEVCSDAELPSHVGIVNLAGPMGLPDLLWHVLNAQSPHGGVRCPEPGSLLEGPADEPAVGTGQVSPVKHCGTRTGLQGLAVSGSQLHSSVLYRSYPQIKLQLQDVLPVHVAGPAGKLSLPGTCQSPQKPSLQRVSSRAALPHKPLSAGRTMHGAFQHPPGFKQHVKM